MQGRLQQAAEGGQVRSVESDDNHHNVSCHHVTGMFTTPATDPAPCHLCQGGEIGFHFKTFSRDLDCDQRIKVIFRSKCILQGDLLDSASGTELQNLKH